MSRTWKRLMSLLLVLAMALSFTVTAYADPKTGSRGTAVDFEKVDNSAVTNFRLANRNELEATPDYADDEVVRVSIVLNDASTLDKGYSAKGIANNTSAMRYRDGLRAKQDALANKISKEVLGGAKLDVVWNMTLAANMISANVEFGKIEAIKNVIGVKDVVLETRYEPETAETAEPNMSTASEMVGGNWAWGAGYTGAGSKVAVVDTGLDTDHELFQGDAFEYSISKLDKDVTLMTAEDVAAVWDKLNIAERLGSVDGVYRNAKVPFGANYVDSDLDITHMHDTQGEHGSHVAGIATGNAYVADGNDGFVPSLEKVVTQGEAPDAQLLVMKVFGKGGGAYDSDYFVAIEDAITLGCDAVNLSLGSSVAGYAYNDVYAETLSKLIDSNIVWCNSAGNNYYWSEHNIGQYGVDLYEDDVNFATGGSPATYNNTLSVASIDNVGMTGAPIYFNGSDEPVFYTETSGYGNKPMTTIAGELDFILVDGPGVDDNDHVGQEGDTFMALGEDLIKGKIAMCSRGSSSFFAKANAAAAQGAAGVIIVNNQGGSISMNLTGYNSDVPVVSITQAEGRAVMAVATQAEKDGVTYYTGKVKITDKMASSIVTENPTMSDFSSWGVPGNLTLKPEITTPGGSIYSVWGANTGSSPQPEHDKYELMSGTSMASPQMAGLAAVMGQYIRENDLLTKTGLSQRQLIQSLIMSTAEPVMDPATGNYYSVMKQGAGLANVENAINAKSYILVTELPDTAPMPAADSMADGKVKIEVGQVQDDSFSAAFTINNFSDEEMLYDLRAEFFTQLIEKGFRWRDTDRLNLAVEWTVNGEPFVPGDADLYDFNGDGAANNVDAQHLLNYCVDNTIKIYNEENADLDKDGDIDTYDAYLAFQGLNSATATIPAGESAAVTVTVSGLKEALGEAPNGNYIEGYLYVKEGDTEEGVIGVEHSIPVFGFYGNWSDASMFDRGSYLEYKYGFGDGDEKTGVYPYMYYATKQDESFLNVEGFLVQYAGDSNTYYLGGNPMGLKDVNEDGEPAGYLPERNAINSSDLIAGVQFSQIRNSGASRFFLTDQYGREIKGSELTGGASYAAYYYRNQDTWQSTSSNVGLNYLLKNQKEGDKINLNYQLVPEYYVNEDGSVRWDELGEGTLMTLPLVIDNTAPDIVDVYRETTEAVPADEEAGTEAQAGQDTLVIQAHDNQYISAVALFTEDGDYVASFPGLSFLKRGEQFEYPFDLNALFTNKETGEVDVPDHLLVAVFDYANNQSTYKVNFNTEELENPDVQVKLNMNEATIVNKGSIRLVANVTPWGFEDESVTWTSSDESVVTVDDNGLVTSVASEDATATVTATSNYDPTKSDSCEITVKFIEQELNGIVWDENGEVWFSEFNTKTLPDYNKLNDSSARLALASAAYDENGTLYAASFDSDERTSTLYTVDPATWEATAVGGESEIGFMDICQAPSLGDNHLLAVYGTSVLIVDKTTGQYEGAFNLGSYINNNSLVGIAYEEQYAHPSYGNTDWVFLLDNAGNIYSTGFLPYNGSYSRFGVTSMGSLGYTVDTPYFQSLYYDGASLFWSRYNAADNKVNIIMVNDLYNDGSIYDLGSFADGVWPVGGLFELGVNPYFGEINGADHSDAVVDTNAVMLTEIQPVDFGAPVTKAGGSLNAMPGTVAKPEKVTTDVTINLTADEDLVTNGLVTVTYDPNNITLKKDVVLSDYKAVVNEPGEYVLAHVTMDGIAKDDTIAQLVFTSDSKGVVTINTGEVNGNNEYGLVETVTLGGIVDEHTEHEWSEPVWNWTGDDENGYTDAIATFTCAIGNEAETEIAEVTSEVVEPTCEEAGKTVYTATVEFNGETYTDTKEVAIEALGHKLTKTDAVEATCTKAGNTEYYTCSVCGKFFSDAEGKTEIEENSWVVEALGHAYGAPEWKWTEDNTATATFTCANDETHVETVDATVTSETTAATCEEAGKTVYTATVTFNGQTYTDTMEVATEALGHIWGEPTWTWAKDGSMAAATFTCTVCEDAQTVLATITSQTVEPTTEKEGSTQFTASVTFEGKTYTDKMTVTIPALAYNLPERMAGKTRTETAVAISQATFPDGAENVILASGDNYPDALAGGPLAYALDAPVLLVRASQPDQATLDEVKRLGAKNVYILGGAGVVSDAVADTMKDMGLNVERLAGATRFETAVRVAESLEKELGAKPTEAFFVFSHNYPDALAVGNIAAIKGAPVLYIGANGVLDEATKEYMTKLGKLEHIYIVGGPGVISEDAETNLGVFGKVDRIYGATRYETCTKVNTFFKDVLDGNAMCVAFGNNYPDALSGSVFAAKQHAPLLLVNTALTDVELNFVKERAPKHFHVFGGEGVVSNEILEQLKEAAK